LVDLGQFDSYVKVYDRFGANHKVRFMVHLVISIWFN